MQIADGMSLTVNGDRSDIHRCPVRPIQIDIGQQLHFDLIAGSFGCRRRRGHGLLERTVCLGFSLDRDLCNRIRHSGLLRIYSIPIPLGLGHSILQNRSCLLRTGLRFCLCRKHGSGKHRKQHTHCQNACQKLFLHTLALLYMI